MEKFFRDLILMENIGYVIWGNKPLAEVVIWHFSPEERKVMEEELKNLSPEDLKTCWNGPEYDLDQNLKKWEQVSDRYSFKKDYLFCRSNFVKNGTNDDKKYSTYYFVDVKQTSLLLQKHYQLFADEVGFEFSPLEVVLEIGDQVGSPFWSALRKSKNYHLIQGILFGYGFKNAALFQWKYDPKLSLNAKTFIDQLSIYDVNPSPKDQKIKLHGYPFLLPGFVSFEEEDPVVNQYKRDREKIVEIFRNGPVLDITLKKLMTYSTTL